MDQKEDHRLGHNDAILCYFLSIRMKHINRKPIWYMTYLSSHPLFDSKVYGTILSISGYMFICSKHFYKGSQWKKEFHYTRCPTLKEKIPWGICLQLTAFNLASTKIHSYHRQPDARAHSTGNKSNRAAEFQSGNFLTFEGSRGTFESHIKIMNPLQTHTR